MRLLDDIRRYGGLTGDRKIYLVSFLVAVSGILSVIDTMLPKPLPMLKLGISNIVTLVLILEDRPALAGSVAFLRTIVSAVMIGTLFSYTFLLSFSGAMASVLFTWLFFRWLGDRLSVIGLSVVGAFFNTVFQGIVVVLFFGWDKGILLLLSLFLLLGTVNGIVIGLVVKWVYPKLARERN
jgi:heptaprenyl diphosphate synthase